MKTVWLVAETGKGAGAGRHRIAGREAVAPVRRRLAAGVAASRTALWGPLWQPGARGVGGGQPPISALSATSCRPRALECRARRRMAVVRQAPMRVFCLLLAAFATLAGCGGGHDRPPPPLPAAVSIGSTRDHRPGALSAATRSGAPIGRLRCARTGPRRFGAHVEVFGRRRTVIGTARKLLSSWAPSLTWLRASATTRR